MKPARPKGLPARRLAAGVLVWLATCAAATPLAQAAPQARLHVRFIPERLGHYTTLEFNAAIGVPGGGVPAPMTQLDVSYPHQLGVTVGELGLSTCSLRQLNARGLRGCPANSHMGEGSALAEIPIGPEILQETASVAILRAPEEHERLSLLFYATGISPVYAQLAFPGFLSSAPPPYGARIHIDVPLVPSLPEGPNVSVVKMHATVGPLGLTYYEYVHGKRVGYKPRGILLPRRCPPGGFAFRAAFAFLDGSSATADTRVRCPKRG